MKPQEEHNVDKIFQRLAGYEAEPPDGVWDSIEEALGRKKKSRLMWFRLLSAAAILAFAVLSGYYFGRQSRPVASDLSQKNIPAATEAMTENSHVPSFVPASDEKRNPAKNNPVRQMGGFVQMALENSTTSNERKDEEENFLKEQQVSFPFLQLREPAMEMTIKWNLPGIKERLLLASLSSDEGIVVEPDEHTQNAPVRYFSLDGQAGPLLAFRNVHDGNREVLADASGISMKSKEEPLATYAGVLRVNYQVTKRISIGTGMGYSGMGLQWKESFSPSAYSFNGTDILQNKESVAYSGSSVGTANSLGNIPALEGLVSSRMASSVPAESSFSELKFVQQLGYVEVPVLIRYALTDGRLGVSLSTGIINHFLVRNSVFMNSANGKTDLGSTEGIRPWNYSGAAALGFDYHLTGNITMRLEPAFKYYLNPSNTTGSFSTHLFSFGVYSGLSYTFK